ncbi:MAG: hypothetical protein QOJ07_2608 [Thermoleophilaceae bacterium]|jgi:hypothetical protein|nr:hypothetical protein [Thermoleophilaceae bacterium]
MTTFITDQQARRLADIEVRTRQAWAAYTESLRDLRGRDYEDAEDSSWDRLQKTLSQLEEERQLLAGA